jgi:uncharacterized protein with ParB-like and HNH nuclease domain
MATAEETKKLADQLFPKAKDEDELEVKNIPPQQRRLHTETADYTVSTLFSLMIDQKLKIPDFQRGYVWNRSQASRLIESLIIQCPIPVVYLSQEPNGDLIVIDGQQRLSSIKYFLSDAIALQGLTTYPELNDYIATELDPRILDHIKNRTIRCITILKDTHPQIKYDVFERLNTGSVKLNAHELRNGLNQGSLMLKVNSLAGAKDFKAVTSTKKDSRMKAAELVLRFFAFKANRLTYEKPLSSFLDNFAYSNRNAAAGEINKLEADFLQAKDLCLLYFGADAFKMYNPELQRFGGFNSAIYDSQMLGISDCTNQNVLSGNADSAAVKAAFVQLFDDAQYVGSVQRATSDETAVRRRIEKAVAAFDAI